MNIKVLRNTYSIYQFKIHSRLPEWISSSDFYSITKSCDELSVVAMQNDSTSESVKSDRDWRILKITGPLSFSLVGIIADISNILKEKKIPIFVISSYETDYILVKQRKLDASVKALEEKGYIISSE